MIPDSTIDLRALLRDPSYTARIRPEDIPGLLGELEKLKAVLWSRVLSGAGAGGLDPHRSTEDDQLLTVKEASQTLNVSTDWLYRHASRLPFTVRLGDRRLRFSMRGIQRHIRTRMGR